MKKIISLTLAALMLVTMLSFTSCEVSTEAMTGYTQLRDHLSETVGDNNPAALDHQAAGLNSASVSTVTLEGGDREVRALGYALTGNYVLQLTLTMNGSSEKAHALYEVLNVADGKVLSSASITVLLTHYTGDDTVVFDSVKGITPVTEQTNRNNASALLNSLLLALDMYTTKELDLNLRDMGFIVLSEKYMVDAEKAEAEENLGGAFSSERLSMAGLMILQGVGMVFLVLAILWLVLLVFKKVFYKAPAKNPAPEKKAAPAPAVAPAPAAVPAVPATDDGALVAAITAAVAAYIESDPALASQFASGFRVVSFKPTAKNRNR